MSAAEEAWYVAAFRDEYVDVYPHRDLASARIEAAWLVEHGVGGKVLDLCCGFGRHALALCERGVDVVGVDLSLDLLRRARHLPGAGALAGRLLCADARHVPFPAACFASVVNLFSSFGYFGADGDRRMLDEIARVIRPGGLLVMDLMNPPRVRSTLVPRSRTERGAVELVEERVLLEGGARVRKTVTLTHADGRRRSWVEDVRMYEPGEVGDLLSERGLVIEHVDGGFAGEAAGPDAPRQIVRARANRYHRHGPH